MGIRAIIAAVFSILAVIAGACAIMNLRGAGLGDVFACLLFQGGPNTLLCSIALWASLAAFLFSIVFAYATFIAVDDDTHHRPLPWIIAPTVMLIGFFAFWYSLSCISVSTAPISVPAPIEAVEEIEELPVLLEKEEQEQELAVIAAPPPSQLSTVSIQNTGASWPYKMPIIDAPTRASREASAAFVADYFVREKAMVRQMCDASWVAVIGSTSQEGPVVRNEKRAKMRATMVVKGLDAHLDREQGCRKPKILGLTLGQHRPVLIDVDDTGVATGYQRQIQFIVQKSNEGQGNAIDARSSLQEWLENAENQSALVGGRAFSDAPIIFDPLN